MTLFFKVEQYDKPFVFEENEGAKMEPSDISRFLLQSYSLIEPYWNKRSAASMLDSATNGLFYIQKRLHKPGSPNYRDQESTWAMKQFRPVIEATKNAG